MAQLHRQRRNLENPEAQPKPSMENTLKKQPQIRAKPDHKLSTPKKSAFVDTHLQAKAMTVSMVDVDSSKFSSLAKPTHKTKTIALERGRKATTNDVSKGKSERSSKELDNKFHVVKVKEREKRRELHEGVDFKGVLEKVKDIELEDGKRPSVSLGFRGGRRRSFCGSQVELADVFASTGVKVVSVDMPPFMQIHAANCARKTYDSLEKLSSKALALTIKKEFDGVYGPAWHCIVGTSFGSFVTHSVGGFMYFSVDQKLHILLFKTTVQKAD